TWGVFKCAVRDVPREVIADDGVRFLFKPQHAPLDTCYAHSEIGCEHADTQERGEMEPSKTAKNQFRINLAKGIVIVIEPGS
ncbi:MAG: hypothetical protein ACK5UT_23335, partial [Acidobacteriota bacterium]